MFELLRHVQYEGDRLLPTLCYGSHKITPRDKSITLTVDTTKRYCIGWHDLESAANHPCPDNAIVADKHFICLACRQKTGFNPAFYHTTSISPQQEKRNLEPHSLYLAHFGNGYIKVGISWAKRGLRRLLEQGARSAVILNPFSSANIARQYEARLAAEPDIHESTPQRTKLELLKQPYNPKQAAKELLDLRQLLSQKLQMNFAANQVLYLDRYYFDQNQPNLADIEIVTTTIVGKVLGIVGNYLVTDYEGRTLLMSLSNYFGYPIKISDFVEHLDLPPRQASLF